MAFLKDVNKMAGNMIVGINSMDDGELDEIEEFFSKNLTFGMFVEILTHFPDELMNMPFADVMLKNDSKAFYDSWDIAMESIDKEMDDQQ